ncbi:MAG: hypothetical protein CMN30_07570 [Sandaracinus sp.]|nr:hypothetical protein [Sandaracinus sp.]
MRVGVNFWQAPWVQASDPDRLRRELDLLAEHGVRELRLMAAAEGPDQSGRIVPSLRPTPTSWSAPLEDALEATLHELAARDMEAILCLGNFWSWSGGLTQLRAWAHGGAIPEPPDGEAFRAYAAGFYGHPEARALYADHLEHIVARLREAPAIACWQILNEPRGLHDPEGMRAFLGETATLLKRLDPERPVATGSEGSTADPAGAGLDFARDHAHPAIDWCTCHLWPENWELWDPHTADEARFAEVLAWARAYLRRHAEAAAALGKPLLFEETGLARDGRRMGRGPTTYRDRFFAAMLDEARSLRAEGLPLRSVLFWAWSGEALDPPGPWGGDPPHEPPGWYGIGSTDHSTLAVLAGARAEPAAR